MWENYMSRLIARNMLIDGLIDDRAGCEWQRTHQIGENRQDLPSTLLESYFSSMGRVGLILLEKMFG